NVLRFVFAAPRLFHGPIALTSDARARPADDVRDPRGHFRRLSHSRSLRVVDVPSWRLPRAPGDASCGVGYDEDMDLLHTFIVPGAMGIQRDGAGGQRALSVRPPGRASRDRSQRRGADSAHGWFTRSSRAHDTDT